MAQTQWNIAFPKCFCKLRSQTKSFSVINVNVILTLQLSPHVGHFDQHGGWAAESKSCWRMLRKNFWSGNSMGWTRYVMPQIPEEFKKNKFCPTDVNLIINRKRKFQNSNAGAKQKLILPSMQSLHCRYWYRYKLRWISSLFVIYFQISFAMKKISFIIQKMEVLLSWD